jgi:hypothetical protein
LFTRAEQTALRELIADREALRARVAALEDGAVKVVTSNLPLERFEALEKRVDLIDQTIPKRKRA